jgi:hypothetical protein
LKKFLFLVTAATLYLEWRAGLSDIMVKGTLPRNIPARFGLIWFSGFRGKDLNVIFYQNMPNFHNRYKSAEINISQTNPKYMLNYSLPYPMVPPSIQDTM